jgi:hypothetical protein
MGILRWVVLRRCLWPRGIWGGYLSVATVLHQRRNTRSLGLDPLYAIVRGLGREAIGSTLNREKLLIKRTSKKRMLQLLHDQFSTWRILDLASGARSKWPSHVVADREDHSLRYPHKTFHQCLASETPFQDKEFDFVIASHIAEHVLNPEAFLKELMRIGKRGYIEIPTPLFDNLIIYNRVEHHWWVTFDDVEKCLIYTNRLNVLAEHIGIPEYLKLEPYFRCSAVTELYWDEEIKYKVDRRHPKKEVKEWLLGFKTLEDMGVLNN